MVIFAVLLHASLTSIFTIFVIISPGCATKPSKKTSTEPTPSSADQLKLPNTPLASEGAQLSAAATSTPRNTSTPLSGRPSASPPKPKVPVAPSDKEKDKSTNSKKKSHAITPKSVKKVLSSRKEASKQSTVDDLQSRKSKYEPPKVPSKTKSNTSDHQTTVSYIKELEKIEERRLMKEDPKKAQKRKEAQEKIKSDDEDHGDIPQVVLSEELLVTKDKRIKKPNGITVDQDGCPIEAFAAPKH
ncbi:hypothetical protein L596_010085 [Steinernema carpocapsae]|uniref:Uncharacterized protein n=1 Tax=Steinernema carpocapsae TaxID=34508 RepID=A0A4U5PHB7_STECR|nr:hypothetical protein L596_010085 [Steinernema carpocapsae]